MAQGSASTFSRSRPLSLSSSCITTRVAPHCVNRRHCIIRVYPAPVLASQWTGFLWYHISPLSLANTSQGAKRESRTSVPIGSLSLLRRPRFFLQLSPSYTEGLRPVPLPATGKKRDPGVTDLGTSVSCNRPRYLSFLLQSILLRARHHPRRLLARQQNEHSQTRWSL